MSIGSQERDFFTRELLSNIVGLLISSNNWDLGIINVGSCKPTKVIDLAIAHMRQHGKKITLDNYNDKIFVADFFFTKCPSICPIMTDNMLELQKQIIADDSVMIISFSVDPKNDTVEQLNNYAEEKGIDQKKWNLLTGDKTKIYDLARKSFFVAELDNKDENEIIHTENFVLVDPDKRIRGYYDGTNIDEVLKILDDIETLKNEYSKFN